jgi:hypothetical protein
LPEFRVENRVRELRLVDRNKAAMVEEARGRMSGIRLQEQLVD